MLDTNTVSQLIRGAPAIVRERLVATPMADICISAITEGELRFGLARRPAAIRLAAAVEEFLRGVDVLSWDRRAADRYGSLRAALERRGIPLGNLDTLIAAHALAVGARLVSSDGAFRRIPELRPVDWATA